MNIWQTVKLVLISIVALVALTVLTVDRPEVIEKKPIDIANLPKSVELVGYDEQKFNPKSIIKPGVLIFVGNDQSIILANTFNRLLNLPLGELVIVSNISDAPWFMKSWQSLKKNEKLKGDQYTPWIYDVDGKMRTFLQVPTSDVVKYFIYKVGNDGIIQRIYNGKMENFEPTQEPSVEMMEETLQEAVQVISKQ
jgi:hypothetical protein